MKMAKDRYSMLPYDQRKTEAKRMYCRRQNKKSAFRWRSFRITLGMVGIQKKKMI
jgi:hypothetical protein